ncbi:hypothetical protein KIL84_009885 [Mauremys mutica]|uniref:Uncharacterized protein n=1 Tax=Mauremys mutica TaxID=74926 RepID=A0A9D4B674_9SAUR|nr:hypothetical protein KIL84_009885 [Mauremys mutica]
MQSPCLSFAQEPPWYPWRPFQLHSCGLQGCWQQVSVSGAGRHPHCKRPAETLQVSSERATGRGAESTSAPSSPVPWGVPLPSAWGSAPAPTPAPASGGGTWSRTWLRIVQVGTAPRGM